MIKKLFPDPPSYADVVNRQHQSAEFALLDAQAEYERAVANVEMCTQRLARLAQIAETLAK